jgi:hypothetical protein
MGVLYMQFQKVTSKDNVLHEELATCQTKCLGGCEPCIIIQQIVKL